MSDRHPSASIIVSAGTSVGHRTLYPSSWTVAPSGVSGFDVSMPDYREAEYPLLHLLGLFNPVSSVMSAPVPSDLTAYGVCGLPPNYRCPGAAIKS